jgi:membrane protease YdiL (CAAX protease family)
VHVQNILSFHFFGKTTGSFALLHKIVFGIMIVLIGPVMEEIVFRGIILTRLAVKWDLKRAILISSLFFGLLHGDDGGVGAFVFGVIMAVLYVKTRTLAIPIILHMLNNAIGYGFMLIPTVKDQSATIDQLQSGIWLGIFLTVISLPGLIYYLWKNWPKRESELSLLAFTE